MKEYDVTITETLQRTVTVEADSKEEARQAVEDAWSRQDYVLGAEDFTDVDFTADAEREIGKDEKLEVLLIKPGAFPQPVSIGSELQDLQAAVGGYIEVTYPFEEQAALVVNEEGKLNGLPLNRAIRTDDGDIADIIAGNFLVVGLSEDSFASLSPELMEKFEKQFHQPETFLRMGRSVMSVPISDDMVRKTDGSEKENRQTDAKRKSAPDKEAI